MPRSAHPARSARKSAKPAAKRSRASPATSSTGRYASKVPRGASRGRASQVLQDDSEDSDSDSSFRNDEEDDDDDDDDDEEEEEEEERERLEAEEEEDAASEAASQAASDNEGSAASAYEKAEAGDGVDGRSATRPRALAKSKAAAMLRATLAAAKAAKAAADAAQEAAKAAARTPPPAPPPPARPPAGGRAARIAAWSPEQGGQSFGRWRAPVKKQTLKLILNNGLDRVLSLDELITAAIVGLKLPNTRESRTLLSSPPWLGAIGTIKRGTYSFLHTLALRSLCNFPFAVDHEVTDANGEVIDYESRDTITEPLLTKSSTNPIIYARMVGNHKVGFPKLLAAPQPYHLRNGFPFAHSFHATIVEGRLLNFSHPDFEPTIADFLSYLDVLLTLNLLATFVMVLPQAMTFKVTKDATGAVVKEEYGKWDSSCCTFEKLEEIKAWLLNPDSCPTRWQRLLDIRRAHGVVNQAV